MRSKKRLYKHLLVIYVLYFATLVVGFAANFLPDFTHGYRTGMELLSSDIPQGRRSYIVTAPIRSDSDSIAIADLPANVIPSVAQLNMQVSVDEPYTILNGFKALGNNGYCYLLMVITGLSYLVILILIALIIYSLNRSIRHELPLRPNNIFYARLIGALILLAVLSEALMDWLVTGEAARLLEGTSFEVVTRFPLDYWNLIVGILFLFMAEVLSLSTQLSEEQKLTI